MYDIAIIGAGVTGTAIARELAQYKLKIGLIEKNSDVAGEATAANAGIIYDGYNAKADKLKGKLMLRGNARYDELGHDLSIRFERRGLLVPALAAEELATLQELYRKGVANVPELRLLNRDEVRALEPELSEQVVGALYSPACGILYPWEVAIAQGENAMDNGVELLLNREITAINRENKAFKLMTNGKVIEARYVINCAGVYADKINEMVAAPSFKIVPKRGQYIVLDKRAGNFVHKIIVPCKTENEKRVSIIPTVGGNLLLGPAMDSVADPEANQVTGKGLAFVRKSAAKLAAEIPLDQTIQAFAGIKAKAELDADEGADFIIEEAAAVNGFINVAGINSPGLTCAPAIAEYVAEIVRRIYQTAGEALAVNEDFNPRRRPVIRFRDLPDREKAELIKADPRYGRIICRCETVTEGEIVDAIRRKCGATTVKGVKRRTGSGLGRCQGGFCGPRIVEILARELGKEMTDIRYDQPASYILNRQS